MNLDKTTIILIAIALFLFLYSQFTSDSDKKEAISNIGALKAKNKLIEDDENEDSIDDSSDENADENETITNDNDEQSEDSDEDEEEKESEDNVLVKKMIGKNHRLRGDGDFKKYSYENGSRGGESSEDLDEFFKSYKQDAKSNDKFSGFDEQVEGLATYLPGKKDNKDDMFNAKELLPKEENEDWFETHHNVKVKNAHLINVYRPVGANTVSSSLRNASHDFRGDIANPRMVVSPWMQSTIDADTNNRGLCKV